MSALLADEDEIRRMIISSGVLNPDGLVHAYFEQHAMLGTRAKADAWLKIQLTAAPAQIDLFG